MSRSSLSPSAPAPAAGLGARRRILVVDQRQARLVELDEHGARERHDEHFPRTAPTDDHDRRGHHHQPEPTHRLRRHLDAFLRQVAAEVDTIGRDGTPLLVAAAEPVLGRVRRLITTPVVGIVRGHHVRTPVSRLVVLARAAEQQDHRARRALDGRRLRTAVECGDAVLGPFAVGEALTAGRVRAVFVAEPAAGADSEIAALVERALARDVSVHVVDASILVEGIAALTTRPVSPIEENVR